MTTQSKDPSLPILTAPLQGILPVSLDHGENVSRLHFTACVCGVLRLRSSFASRRRRSAQDDRLKGGRIRRPVFKLTHCAPFRVSEGGRHVAIIQAYLIPYT